MTTNQLWYLPRGTGTILLLVLAVVVALGIAVRGGKPLPGIPKFAVTLIHRNLSLFALVLLTVHVLTMVYDPYAFIDWIDLVLPFHTPTQTLWYGLGTLSLDVMVALAATSLLRHRIGLRTWRAIHWAGYAAFPLAVAHGLGSGTDAWSWWLLTVTAISLALVGVATGWRVHATRRPYPALTTVPSHRDDRAVAEPVRVPVSSAGSRS